MSDENQNQPEQIQEATQATLPDKIGFPSGMLYERPLRLDIVDAKKGLFAAINKPADVLFESYVGSPELPVRDKSGFIEEQKSSVIAAIRKQLGKPELARLGIEAPFCALQADFEASGIGIVACNKGVAAAIRNAVGSEYITFQYLFLARKSDIAENFETNLPMVKNENRDVWAVSHRYGRKSKTRFELVETCRDFQLFRAIVKNIRPHQVRLHAAERGLKIVGEKIYSRGGQIFISQFRGNYKLKRNDEFERPIYPHIFLHLEKVSFDGANFAHPELGANEIVAPLPKNFQLCLDKISFKFGRDNTIFRS